MIFNNAFRGPPQPRYNTGYSEIPGEDGGSARSSKMSLSLHEGSTNRGESLGCGATESHTMSAAPGITQKGQHYYVVVPHKS